MQYDDAASEDYLTSEDLAFFRRQLLAKRAEVLAEAQETIKSETMHLNADEMKDEVDCASVTIQQDITVRLLDRLRKLLREIDHALEKIDNGDFGFCEGTGELIPRRRLELSPWVRHSVEYKERLERLKKMRRLSAGQADRWEQPAR